MKNLMSFICLLTMVLLSGCTQEEMLGNAPTASDGRVFTTSFENNESRTYLENGLLARWTAGDRISLFDGNSLNREYQFDGKTGDNAGTFSMVNNTYGTGTELKTNYAVYPYAEDVKITSDGVITTTLPAQQHYAENSYGLGDNTMVAVTHNIYDTFLTFKNVGSCIKLQLYGNDVTVKSITLTGNNGEKIAGKANITVAYDKAPVVSMADDATTSITLDCGEGVKIGATQEEATTFWMTLPPVTFEKGITVKVTDTNGGVFTQTTEKELVVARNVVKPMAAVETIPQSKEIPYLTFSANKSQTLTMSQDVNTLQYSVGDGEWKNLGTTTVTFGGSKGNLRLRGKNLNGTTFDYADAEYSQVILGDKTVSVACSGDIRTLLDYENFQTVNTENARFCWLFEDCTNLTSAPELPATTLASYCYSEMFNGCTSLIQAPELPATTLSNECYSEMFYGCTSLTQAPNLPATVLAYKCYSEMFEECTGLTQAPELPAKTLAECCYSGMFSGCIKLTNAPELPASTMESFCYSDMFYGCTSLTEAPELPATTLAESCYSEMFNNCTSLTKAPELPATTLAESCYSGMFNNCASLTKAPELPATTLTESCYSEMFNNCTSLTKAPELPATTLAGGCYAAMFGGCINLTEAPKLPVTTLIDSCYSLMFYGCSSLTQAPELPATILTYGCYESMFEGCSNLAKAPQLPATALASLCYYSMFKDCINLTEAPILPATTLTEMCYAKMFNGCSQLNSITMLATDISAFDCLNNWVEGVASEGTFTKAKEMNILTKGSNGIPNEWAVKDYNNYNY